MNISLQIIKFKYALKVCLKIKFWRDFEKYHKKYARKILIDSYKKKKKQLYTLPILLSRYTLKIFK